MHAFVFDEPFTLVRINLRDPERNDCPNHSMPLFM